MIEHVTKIGRFLSEKGHAQSIPSISPVGTWWTEVVTPGQNGGMAFMCVNVNRLITSENRRTKLGRMIFGHS